MCRCYFLHYHQKLPPTFLKILHNFYSRCWDESEVPQAWKEAQVVGILKPGKPARDPASYHPISLTPHLGKVYERIIKRSLLSFYSYINVNLEVHKQILRFANNAVNEIVQQAKPAFYNAQILACTTTKKLFMVTDALMARIKSSPLPSSVCLSDLPHKLCELFTEKICNIRTTLDAQSETVPKVHYNSFSGNPLTDFEPVTVAVVRTDIRLSPLLVMK